MITFCATGQRDYRVRPVPIHRRAGWEFEAIVSGPAAPLLERGRHPAADRILWTFPPELAHGWTGPGGLSAVVVIHSGWVPDLLARVGRQLSRRGIALATRLTDHDIERIRWLQQRLANGLRGPHGLSRLEQEHAVMELALIALRQAPQDLLPSPAASAHAIMDRVAAWCGEHLAEGASIAGAAAAVGVSPAQLRRVCRRACGQDARSLLCELRLRRADDLLLDRRLDLADIARACGFSSVPALSRAYRRKRGRPPGRAR